jgi:hypothetical protein
MQRQPGPSDTTVRGRGIRCSGDDRSAVTGMAAFLSRLAESDAVLITHTDNRRALRPEPAQKLIRGRDSAGEDLLRDHDR